MIWEIHQQTMIADANRTADRAQNKVETYDIQLKGLLRQMERLTLACHSMWELIRDNTDLTEADLEEKILEVDLRDGAADGKMATQILTCPSCGKNTNSKRSVCVMCGEPVKAGSPFQS